MGLASSGAGKEKFDVFESLANDAMNLRGSVEKLIRAFGAVAARAILVLATKADRLQNPVQRENRLNLIRQVVRDHGLHGPALWQNEEMGDGQPEQQLATLRDGLAQIEGVAISDLEDLRERRRLEAQQVCDAYPTQTKTTEVEIDKQYTVPRDEEKAYEESYVDTEQYTEEYEAPETYVVPERHSYTYEKRRGGIAGLLGDTKTCTGYHTVNVQKVRFMKKQRTATRPVIRTRTAYHTVKKYDTKTWKKTVQKTVEYRLTVDHFMEEPLQKIIDDVKQCLSRL